MEAVDGLQVVGQTHQRHRVVVDVLMHYIPDTHRYVPNLLAADGDQVAAASYGARCSLRFGRDDSASRHVRRPSSVSVPEVSPWANKRLTADCTTEGCTGSSNASAARSRTSAKAPSRA